MNGSANTAIFGGASPTAVNLTTNITAGTVRFTANNYSVGESGGNRTLFLSGARTFDVGSGVTAGVSMSTISLDGDLTKTGAGTLKLTKSGVNQVVFTGANKTINIVSGALHIVYNDVNMIDPTASLALGSSGTLILDDTVSGNVQTFAGLSGSAGSLIYHAAPTGFSKININAAGGTTTTFNGQIGPVVDPLVSNQGRVGFSVSNSTGTGTANYVLGGNNGLTLGVGVASNCSLKITHPNALGQTNNGSADIANDATLDLNGQSRAYALKLLEFLAVLAGGSRRPIRRGGGRWGWYLCLWPV